MSTDLDQITPLVSVLMTAYNREAFIGEAIESVLASTYRNFELIIVDDMSKDRTIDIAKKYAAKDDRIRVYVNERNLGDYPNRNRAASYARGKYLKYLDSDDKIYDFGLGYCVEQMERSPECGIGMIVHYDMGVEDSVCWSSEKVVHEHFFTRQYLWIGPSGTIIRRDKFEALGGFESRFGVASDMYFNIRIASLSPVLLLQKPFFFYREHQGQEKNNEKGYLKFGYLYFKELMEKGELPLPKNEVHFLFRKMKKRHSINLTRHIFRTKDWRSFRQLMKDTHFGFSDLLSSYFK
jgi:glycosyltransferase involved in cell wall biosynthesis